MQLEQMHYHVYENTVKIDISFNSGCLIKQDILLSTYYWEGNEMIPGNAAQRCVFFIPFWLGFGRRELKTTIKQTCSTIELYSWPCKEFRVAYAPFSLLCPGSWSSELWSAPVELDEAGHSCSHICTLHRVYWPNGITLVSVCQYGDGLGLQGPLELGSKWSEVSSWRWDPSVSKAFAVLIRSPAWSFNFPICIRSDIMSSFLAGTTVFLPSRGYSESQSFRRHVPHFGCWPSHFTLGIMPAISERKSPFRKYILLLVKDRDGISPFSDDRPYMHGRWRGFRSPEGFLCQDPGHKKSKDRRLLSFQDQVTRWYIQRAQLPTMEVRIL